MKLPTIDGIEVGPLIESLADLIFPLESWMSEADKFVPPENAVGFNGLPWRQPGRSLSVKTLHLVESFAEIYAEVAPGDGVAGRWNAIDANPFAAWAVATATPAAWRSARNLPAIAKHFSPEASDNFEYAVANANGSADPITRKDFYDRCFAQLVSVFKLRQPIGLVEWQHILDDMKTDQGVSVIGWDDATAGIKSSVFVRRLGMDLATALLGERPKGSRLTGMWHHAMQIELGEHRRPGNAYGVNETRTAVENVRRKSAEIASKPALKA